MKTLQKRFALLLGLMIGVSTYLVSPNSKGLKPLLRSADCDENGV